MFALTALHVDRPRGGSSSLGFIAAKKVLCIAEFSRQERRKFRQLFSSPGMFKEVVFPFHKVVDTVPQHGVRSTGYDFS